MTNSHTHGKMQRFLLLAAAVGVGIFCTPGRADEHSAAAATFKVGMVSPDGRVEIEGLSDIKNGFARAVNRPVEVMVARDFASLAQAQIDGRIDYAVHSAFSFAATSMRCGCVRAIAAPVGTNGAIGIHSVFIIRPARGLSQGMVGIGPADSVAGRLAPFALYPGAEDADFLQAMVEVGSMSDAESRFLADELTGFFGWAWAWPDANRVPAGGSVRRLGDAGLGDDKFAIAWRSQPIRFGPHAVRVELDEGSVDRLRALLLSGKEPELLRSLDHVHGGGFAPIENTDYAVVETIVRSTAAQAAATVEEAD